MTPQPFDELNTPTVRERVYQMEKFKGENPLTRRGRPKKKEGDAKGK